MLGLEGKDIYILRDSNQSDYREFNLLMISEDGINHYTAIKSLSRLLSADCPVIPNISVNNIF